MRPLALILAAAPLLLACPPAPSAPSDPPPKAPVAPPPVPPPTAPVALPTAPSTAAPGAPAPPAAVRNEGKLLFARRYGDAGMQLADTIDVLPDGDIVLSGAGRWTLGPPPRTPPAPDTLFLTRLDAAGEPRWIKSFGTTRIHDGQSVAIGPTGTIAVAGVFEGTIDFGGGPLVSPPQSKGAEDPPACIFSATFGADGAHRGSKRFCVSKGTAYEALLAFEPTGTLLLAGAIDGAIDLGGGPLPPHKNRGWDLFVSRFDASGKHLMSRRYVDEVDSDFLTSIVPADAGGMLLLGNYAGRLDLGGGPLPRALGSTLFLARVDDRGNLLWNKTFTATEKGPATPWPIVVLARDAKGALYFFGRFEVSLDVGGGPLGSGLRDSLFVAKLDPDGRHLWSRAVGAAPRVSFDRVCLALDGDGNLALAGNFPGDVDFGGGSLAAADGPSFVAKLTTDGRHLWSRRLGNLSMEQRGCVAVDKAGNVLVAGGLHGTLDLGAGPLVSAGGADVLIAKFER